jgi:glucosamine--fructose-6-phosphate aminotransferase (isomerizing)
MDDSVFVIIINPEDSTYQDTLTSAREIKARGAKIIGISDKERFQIRKVMHMITG